MRIEEKGVGETVAGGTGVPAGPRRPARRYADLLVWQKAHRFVLGVYAATKCFPREETFGLTSQLRRAAVSVAANIAEGFRKRTRPEKAWFMNVAQASADECSYHLMLACDLGYADTAPLQAQLDEVCRLLNAYCAALRRER